jgi:HSP20 family protein
MEMPMPVEMVSEQHFGNIGWQMNKIFEQFQKGFSNFCPAETWVPAVNLYECDHAYLVCVDLSGVDKERIELVIADNQLKLRGQRAVPDPPDSLLHESKSGRLRIHLMEIDHGPFCREVELPHDVAQEAIVASYLNGMLWIELPKK